jgi:hypothetical protein
MTILRIDDDGGAVGGTRDARLDPVAGTRGATVVLLHGYKYDPRDAPSDPHALLYRDGPVPARLDRGGRVISWPEGLGFGAAGGGDGLCVAYGWRARAAHAASLAREGLNGFAAAYREAGRAGARLAELVGALGARRDGPVDFFAHSLGARVALAALRAAAEAGRADTVARFGRLVLLGPAEFAGEAAAALEACDRIGAPTPEVYCLVARGNRRYDLLFEAFAPAGARRGGGSLGRLGLGRRRAGWLDLAFDAPALAGLLAERGVALGPSRAGPCHWSFYARPGAMALHRAILERRPGFGPEELRAAGAPGPAPRRPRLRLGPPRLPTPATPLPA